jgi:ABC-type glycerol-3-phosphate transport system substrate-binding protein
VSFLVRGLALTVPGSANVPRSGLRQALLLYAAAPGTITTNPLRGGVQPAVVTSFPKELTQAYKNLAFEKANPGIKIEILNKNTVQGIAYVRELPAGQRPDVFWASAPDAFEVLARPEAAGATWPSWPTRPRRPRSATTRSTTRRACTWARRWPATA